MSATVGDYVKWFRHSSPYINAHRGKTFVLMLPGEALDHPNFANIVHDIALLDSLGVRLVLVQGARPQIDKRLQEAGISSQFHRQQRVTDSASLSAVIEAVGSTRITVEAALSTGLPNSPMHNARLQVISGNFVVAMPQGVIDGVDLQHTGKVRKVNVQALNHVLDSGAVALLSPLGYSPTGEVFNMAYTDVACQVAVALKADKLLAFIDSDGLRDSRGGLLRQLALQECRQFLSESGDTVAPELQQVLNACYLGCLGGVTRAQLVNYQVDGALLTELFTRDGVGTMVHLDNYEQLRTASIEDIGGILELLAPLEQEGVLVRRSRERLEAEINHFSVLEKDGTIIGCAALYPFGEAAEIACLVTHPDYRNSGRAAALLTRLEGMARQQQVQRLFLLTTHTAHWFIEQGFAQGKLDDLPVTRQQMYNYQRNSKIFIKELPAAR